MTEETSEFTEEEARRIWRRAAELQAARRLPVPRAEAGGEPDPDATRLTSAEVRDVAREAGIDPEYVDRALAEASLPAPAPHDGEPPLQARRRIAAPPAAVRRELLEVAARETYRLRLADVQATAGRHALVFALDGPDSFTGGALRAGDFGAGRHIGAVHALLLPGATPEETELVLHAAPNPGLARERSYHDLGFGLFGGGLGATAVGAAGVELLALTGAAVLAPIGVGALALGAAGVALVRRLDRRARRLDATALERLADDVVGAIRIRRFHDELPPPAALEPGG